MNRQQRRAATKQRQSANRRIFISRPLDELEQFDSIDRFFQKLRHGAVEVEGQHIVIMGLHGDTYAVLPALDGWMTYWAELAARNGIRYDDAPLRRLAKSLEYDKPLTEAEVDAAYQVVEAQRRMFRTLPRGEISKVAIEVQQSIMQADEIRELLGVGA